MRGMEARSGRCEKSWASMLGRDSMKFCDFVSGGLEFWWQTAGCENSNLRTESCPRSKVQMLNSEGTRGALYYLKLEY